MSAATASALFRPGLRKLLWAVVGVGALGLALGVAFNAGDVWPGALLGILTLLGLGLAGAFILAMNTASGARWDTQFRRVSEAMAATLQVSVFLALGLLAIAPHLYPWAKAGALEGLAPSLGSKAAYFSPGFFALRCVAFLAGWAFLARLMLGHSRRQDADGLASHRGAMRKLGIAFLVFFAYSFSVAAVDWIGSLQPTWFSTIFGLYCFAGIVQAGFAALILLLLALEKAGVYKGLVREQHLHDLGKWQFAFSCLWAYFWFSQFMLTWFADLPDENQFYLLRGGIWALMIGVTVAARFFGPFFGLASQGAKKSRRTLVAVSLGVLAGHWLDLVVLVVPPVTGGAFAVGLFDVLLPLAGAAAFALLFEAFFNRQAAVPVNDAAALAYSRNYH